MLLTRLRQLLGEAVLMAFALWLVAASIVFVGALVLIPGHMILRALGWL